MNKYLFFMTINVFISCLTQILLKSSANENNAGFKDNFINLKVISAYGVYFLIMLLNAYFLFKNLELNQISIIESFGYIFVPVFSYLFLKEKMNKRQIIGIILILVGIIIFNIS